MGVFTSMGKKLYRVQLLPEERAEFERLISANKAARWKITRAQAMLKCDQGPDGPGWGDELIAQAYGVTTRSLENWRKQAVLQGPLSLLSRKPLQKPPRPPKFDGAQEARLVAMTCGQPPHGHNRWSLRLLAEQAVALDIVDSASHETVRQVLKKRSEALATNHVVHSP